MKTTESGCAAVCSSVHFSSRWYLRVQKSPYALHPVSQKCLQRCLWNGSNVRLIDDGPLSSFQVKLSIFLFTPLASRLSMTSLALCPQVLSQAPQHFRSSEKQATCGGFFARQCIRSLLSLHSRPCRVNESDAVGNVYNWYSNYLSDVSASAGPCIVRASGFLCHQAFLRARQESVVENETKQTQSATDPVNCRRLLQI